jgi:hypothetical protein
MSSASGDIAFGIRNRHIGNRILERFLEADLLLD